MAKSTADLANFLVASLDCPEIPPLYRHRAYASHLTNDDLRKIWAKAESCGTENEANGYRKDQCGAWIKFSEYGNRNSAYGWEVDHIKPTANGGSDSISNLRPLHWKNNAAKSDGRLVCAIKSLGNQNIAA